jgi:demethylmenaquinone methyltransferase/2-methoxy-6-polyprenyl-1,4-benzoquinol methylase
MESHPAGRALDRAFDSPELKRAYVSRLFGTIAARYDLITRVLSFGRDQAWKRRLMAHAGVAPGSVVLDLACGTGDLCFMAAARQAAVVGLDLATPMLVRARDRPGAARIGWIAGDMCALPVASGSVDVVTTGYGLRNVPTLVTAIREAHRVLRPGGRLCALDFERPEAPWLRALSLGYLSLVGGALGWVLHRDADTYRYIAASIRRYPGARAVAALMRDAGFESVQVVPVFGGLMAMHVATRPAGPAADASVAYNDGRGR